MANLDNQALQSFFKSYAEASVGDPTALASRYADAFLVSGPSGSGTFRNDDSFTAWLTEVHQFNLGAGMKSMEVVSIEDLALGDNHAFAIVEWGARFEKTGDELIRFRISYLLQSSDRSPLIIAYVSHEDQEELMRSRGLI